MNKYFEKIKDSNTAWVETFFSANPVFIVIIFYLEQDEIQ